MCVFFLLTYEGFNCTDEENTTSLAALRKRAWLALRAKIDEQTADAVILSKLRSHFEERFRYDDSGVPRVWRPDDDIDGAFRWAKDKARVRIMIFSMRTLTFERRFRPWISSLTMPRSLLVILRLNSHYPPSPPIH
jgi:hypothetical protein